VGDPPKIRTEIQSDGTLKKTVPEGNVKPQSHRICLLKELQLNALEITSSLLKLSVSIRSSPERDDYSKAAARYGISSAWEIQYVKEKYSMPSTASRDFVRDWVMILLYAGSISNTGKDIIARS
jgi:hypothetical protein